jgi:hypothetical protein
VIRGNLVIGELLLLIPSKLSPSGDSRSRLVAVRRF